MARSFACSQGRLEYVWLPFKVQAQPVWVEGEEGKCFYPHVMFSQFGHLTSTLESSTYGSEKGPLFHASKSIFRIRATMASRTLMEQFVNTWEGSYRRRSSDSPMQRKIYPSSRVKPYLRYPRSLWCSGLGHRVCRLYASCANGDGERGMFDTWTSQLVIHT